MYGFGNRFHNNKRSMNNDLVEGMRDGTVKRPVYNHGGIVESTTAETRSELSDYYKVQTAPSSFGLPIEPFVKLRGVNP